MSDDALVVLARKAVVVKGTGYAAGLVDGAGGLIPPTATANAPTIVTPTGGAPRVTDTVYCDTSASYDGTAPFTLTYQWQADGTNIAGATDVEFVVTATELGAVLTCETTATNGAGGPVPFESAPTAAVAAAPSYNTAPVISGVPTVSIDTAAVGYTATATAATLSDGTEPITTTWQWYLDAVAIGGATSATYQTAAIGDLTVEQTETNGAGSDSATSAATTIGAAVAPSNVEPPCITGTRGGTLTATDGEWTGSPDFTYAYQWERSDDGQATWSTVGTASTYSDTGYPAYWVRVGVVATGPGGSSSRVYSQVAGPEVGPVDFADLTPYATSDPNATLSSGTILSGTMAAGAVQLYSDGVISFYEWPRTADGRPFDPTWYLTAFRFFCQQAGWDGVGNGDVTVGVGMAYSAGAVGSGPGGAPATIAECSEILFYGIKRNGGVPAWQTEVLTLQPATRTGGTNQDGVATISTCGVERDQTVSGRIQIPQTRAQLLDISGDALATVNRNEVYDFALPGTDAMALCLIAYRSSTLSGPVNMTNTAKISYAQANFL